MKALIIILASTLGCGVVSRTLDADNIIYQYEHFFDLHTTFEAKLGDMRSHQDLITGETDKEELRRLKMEMNAYRSSCRTIAANYNADSQKLNRTLFKSDDIPYRLEMSSCN